MVVRNFSQMFWSKFPSVDIQCCQSWLFPVNLAFLKNYWVDKNCGTNWPLVWQNLISLKLHYFSLSLKRSQKSPTCCGKATSGSPVCRVENKNIGRKDKKQPTLTPNLGDLDEVPDNHGEPNGPQNRIPGISRVPRMYLDFRSSSNPIGAKLLECAA